VYRTDIKGFLPKILEKWFDERVEFKDKRDEYAVGS
jgi:DNA polymerase elongation subunit (family B)